jgi:hypothetical protein
VAVPGAGAGAALETGTQPQGEEDVGAEGWLAGVSLHGLDTGLAGGQVQFLDQVPDDAGLLLGGEQ